nr:gustatory receptor 13 [Graphosoma rubrolineatum]
MDASRTVRYFQKWKDFEDIWECGTIYSVKRLRFIRIFTTLLPPLMIVVATYEALTLPKISAFVFIPYVPILVAAVLMLEHWWMTLYNLTLYSEKLLTSILKVKNRHDIEHRRRMWLKISQLASEIGDATGASGLSYTCTFFTGFILSIYAILINIASPGTSNVSLWGLFFPAVYSSVSYYLAADAAYRVTERIGPIFTKKLLQTDLSFFQQNVSNEVDLLVNCLSSKPPVIEYLGFMKVTRSTFLHVILIFLSYMNIYVIGATTSLVSL